MPNGARELGGVPQKPDALGVVEMRRIVVVRVAGGLDEIPPPANLHAVRCVAGVLRPMVEYREDFADARQGIRAGMMMRGLYKETRGRFRAA